MQLTRPVSVWNKPLKVDFRGFFKAISAAVIKGASLKFDDMAEKLLDAANTAGLKNDPAQIAWILIQVSLKNAILKLVIENKDLIRSPNITENDIDALCSKLDMSFEENDITIKKDFFRHPKSLDIIDYIKSPLIDWFKRIGLHDYEAKGLYNRLGGKFALELNEEWANKPDRYECIKKSFISTPFDEAVEDELGWTRYKTYLQSLSNERLFAEVFSISDAYIPLRAYYKEIIDSNTKDEKKNHKRIVCNLQSTLIEWIEKDGRKDGKDDKIRIISGGPGSGKSTSVKILAAKIIDKFDIPLLFIPLHLFEMEDDLEKAIDKYINKEGFLKVNPIDKKSGFKKVIMIFDGLDELVMQGQAAVKVSNSFIRELQKQLNIINNIVGINFMAIVTGRELVIQSNESEIRTPHQILHLLPYYLSENEIAEYDYSDEFKLIKEDQRQAWWELYGKLSGKGYVELPEMLDSSRLKEITAIPLLNYLVALSYGLNNIIFTKDTNTNTIYYDLIESIYNKEWDNYKHPYIGAIEFRHFLGLLKYIAISAWYCGDMKTTTIDKIKEICDPKLLEGFLRKFEEAEEPGITRLMTAFYFREANRYGTDKTFEFTHKSFSEYLTAKRIVEFIENLCEERKRRYDSLGKGWDDIESLQKWVQFFSRAPLDIYIFNFIKGELALYDSKTLEMWQNELIYLLGVALKNGFFVKDFNSANNTIDLISQLRNAEEALLVIMNSCAIMTKKISKVDWPSKFSLGGLLSRLQPRKYSHEFILSKKCLSYLDISGCILQSIGLSFADLRHSNLIGSDFYMSDFSGASLSGASLSGASLSGANFSLANLEEASLSGANFSLANLERANLEEANLFGANLKRTNLFGANLKRTNLSGANFSLANLERANLFGANLERASLSGANFSLANLE
ncbi:pentapeptide repeat-containing protein, partial [Candidatus Magnetominusculus xianensis]|uniref:pentapeptide repeat-containing protein n=1 Tax=Candidatus Magnetominusculus xianensis TaxID=1748249 RepID=UPI000A11D388